MKIGHLVILNAVQDIEESIKLFAEKENSKTCLKWPLKIDKTKILMTNGSLMMVESIAECSKGSILQYL